MFGHVEAITFDLDDTLWPCHEVIVAAERACYEWLSDAAPRVTRHHSLESLREHRIAFSHRRPDIAHDMTAVRLHALSEVLSDHGYAVDVARRASDVFRAARNRVTPYDEVVDVLRRLRARYTVISVTNGNSQIEHTPLRDSFDYSLTAAEVGAAKPDPAMFHAASTRCGIGLDRFLHVGDDPVRDVQAARALGIPTVWVDRAATTWPPDIDPADMQVSNIGELAEQLLS
ncbi:MAG: HAD family hydrolase [Gammaproteobacteria bacterium]|nr:HAD family hydrolase [Gammaproteobacteria bacterium]